MVKKIGILIGCLFGLFLVAAIVLPFLVDVDKFRPEIVKAVNQKINGELQLGKLELSLWGGLRIKIESLSLTGKSSKKPILSTNSAYISVPFLSLLVLRPSLTAVLQEPQVEIIKQKNGKMNVMELMKEEGTSAEVEHSPDTQVAANETQRQPAQQEPSKQQQEPSKTVSPAIPAFVANASVGLRIKNGKFKYIDEVAAGNYLVDGVELDLQNLGLKETIRFSLELPIKGKSPTMDMDGVVTAEGKIKPIFSAGMVRSASGELKMDATKLAVKMTDNSFQKSAQIPLKVEISLDGTEDDLRINNMNLQFHEVRMQAKGFAKLAPQQSVSLDITMPAFKIDSFADLVPMLKEYQLAGMMNMNVKVNGPTEKIKVQGDMELKSGRVAYPAMLKEPLQIEVKSAFTENSLNLTKITANATGTDILLKGMVQNFAAPQFNLFVDSKQVDVDKLLKLDAKDAKTKKTASVFFEPLIATAYAAKKAHVTKKTESKSAPNEKSSTASAGNPMLVMAKNPVIAGAQGSLNVNIGKLIAYGTPITDISAKAVLRNLVFTLESASLKTFDGILNAKANADLKSPALSYSTSGTIKGLSAKNALTTYLPKFKDTLEGKVNANWNLNGVAFPEAIRMRSLAGTVNVNALDGRLRSVNIQDSIKEIMAKVPFLKDKQAPKFDEGFESMRADLKFSNGVIDANPMEIIGKGKGLNIKGKSKIQESLEQETFVDVFDPHQLLPKEISNGKDAALALRVTGTLSNPVTDYGYTVSRLAKNVMQNEGGKLLGKGLQKILGGSGDSKTAEGGAAAPAGKPADAVKDILKKVKLF